MNHPNLPLSYFQFFSIWKDTKDGTHYGQFDAHFSDKTQASADVYDPAIKLS